MIEMFWAVLLANATFYVAAGSVNLVLDIRHAKKRRERLDNILDQIKVNLPPETEPKKETTTAKPKSARKTASVQKR